jgi:hypothetical protein
MTAKEKAQEIVNQFRKYSSGEDEYYMFSPAIEKENAKLCAVLAVDEILKVASFYNDSQAEVIYWQEVKKEIHKL